MTGNSDSRRLRKRSPELGIVRHETDINARVYALFNLDSDDIATIEAQTKYPYGEP